MKILFVGFGNLGSQVFDLFLLRAKKGDRFLVGGRNLAYIQERIRWTTSAALQLGTSVQADAIAMDVHDIDQTAQTIATFKPDVIFSSATTLPSSIISQLPPEPFETLAQARGGPWLPTTLVLVHKLMQAVKQTGLKITVLNGATPDASHTVLHQVGCSPTCGIGNIAMHIPPIKHAIAEHLYVPLAQIHGLFLAPAYGVQRLRTGTTGGAPFHLAAYVDGKDVTEHLDLPALFAQLPLTLEHEYTQLLTAATAVTICDALTSGTSEIIHAPGPNGLPGGYPLRLGTQGLEVALPPGLELEEAIRINQEGQKLEGIECIDPDGTVHFTERNMAILKETLGYECLHMPLSEVEERAKEIREKYDAFASHYR